MNIDKMREEFEAHYVKAMELDMDQAGEALVRFPEDRTKYWPDVQPFWEFWQASRESLVIELPPSSDTHDQFWKEDVIEAIKFAGLKVAP